MSYLKKIIPLSLFFLLTINSAYARSPDSFSKENLIIAYISIIAVLLLESLGVALFLSRYGFYLVRLLCIWPFIIFITSWMPGIFWLILIKLKMWWENSSMYLNPPAYFMFAISTILNAMMIVLLYKIQFFRDTKGRPMNKKIAMALLISVIANFVSWAGMVIILKWLFLTPCS